MREPQRRRRRSRSSRQWAAIARMARSRVRRPSGRCRRPSAAATGWAARRAACGIRRPRGRVCSCTAPAPGQALQQARPRAGRRPRPGADGRPGLIRSPGAEVGVGRRSVGWRSAAAVGVGRAAVGVGWAVGVGGGSAVGFGDAARTGPVRGAVSGSRSARASPSARRVAVARRRSAGFGSAGPGSVSTHPDGQLVRVAQLGAVGPVQSRPPRRRSRARARRSTTACRRGGRSRSLLVGRLAGAASASPGMTSRQPDLQPVGSAGQHVRVGRRDPPPVPAVAVVLARPGSTGRRRARRRARRAVPAARGRYRRLASTAGAGRGGGLRRCGRRLGPTGASAASVAARASRDAAAARRPWRPPRAAARPRGAAGRPGRAGDPEPLPRQPGRPAQRAPRP